MRAAVSVASRARGSLRLAAVCGPILRLPVASRMAGSLARAEAVAHSDAPEKSTKPRFDANSIPGGHLPPLEPTKAEIYNVVFEYGVLIGNFLMIAFIATWYMKKVAWTKDPGEPPVLCAPAGSLEHGHKVALCTVNPADRVEALRLEPRRMMCLALRGLPFCSPSAAEDLSRSTRPLVTRASSDPAFDPILPGAGERG